MTKGADSDAVSPLTKHVSHYGDLDENSASGDESRESYYAYEYIYEGESLPSNYSPRKQIERRLTHQHSLDLEFNERVSQGFETSLNNMPAPGVYVACQNLSVTIKNRTILDNVTFYAQPGMLTAIIGPSGCGKTTLLNALSGRLAKKRIRGNVYYTTDEGGRNDRKNFLKYVMTHDIVLPYLTVRQTLSYAAELRLSHLTAKERSERVYQVMSDLEILDCADVYVDVAGVKKGTSTGQTKRLAIGVELLDNPSVLMLDEPTSCLDAAMSFELMIKLKNLARKRRVNIIFVIHQPRTQIFELFDNVALMRKGKMLYCGPTSDLVDVKDGFLTTLGYPIPEGYNPADFCINLVSEVDAHDDDGGHDIKIKELSNAANIYLTDLEIEIFETKFWTSPDYGLQLKQDVQYSMELAENIVKVEQVKRDRWRIFRALIARSWTSTTHNPLNTYLSLFLITLQYVILASFGLNLVGNADHYRDSVVEYLDNPHTAAIDWTTPNMKITKAFLETVIYGVDLEGENLLLDVFENGFDTVDGTHPIFDVIDSLDWLVDSVNTSAVRIRKFYHLDAMGYTDPAEYLPITSTEAPVANSVIKIVDNVQIKAAAIPWPKSKLQTGVDSKHVRSLMNSFDIPLSKVDARLGQIPTSSLVEFENSLLTLMQMMHYVINYVDLSAATQCMQFKYDTCIGIHHCVTGDNTAGELDNSSRVPTWHDQFNAAPRMVENLPSLYSTLELLKTTLRTACGLGLVPANVAFICAKNDAGDFIFNRIPSTLPVVESKFFYYNCEAGCDSVYDMKSDNLSILTGVHEVNSPQLGAASLIIPKCQNTMRGAPVHMIVPDDLTVKWNVGDFGEKMENGSCFIPNDGDWLRINTDETQLGRISAQCGCLANKKLVGSGHNWTCPTLSLLDGSEVSCDFPTAFDATNCWHIPNPSIFGGADGACMPDCTTIEQYYDEEPISKYSANRTCVRSDKRWQTVGDGPTDELTESDIWNIPSLLSSARMADPGFDLFVECLLGQLIPPFIDAMVAFNLPPLFEPGDLAVDRQLFVDIVKNLDENVLPGICINDTTCLDDLINLGSTLDTYITEWTGMHVDEAFGADGLAVLRTFDPVHPNSSTKTFKSMPHRDMNQTLGQKNVMREILQNFNPSAAAELLDTLKLIDPNQTSGHKARWYSIMQSPTKLIRKLSAFKTLDSELTKAKVTAMSRTGGSADPTLTIVEIVTFVKDAAIGSVLTTISIATGLFLFAGNLGFSNMASLIQFPQERFLFNRERQNGLYGTFVWFTAKQISDFLIQIGPSMIAFIPWYFMTGFEANAKKFFMSWFAQLSCIYLIIGVNYTISAASARMEHAISVAPVYFVIQFVCVGFFIPPQNMQPWYSWFRYLSTFRYAFYGIITANFNDGYIGILPATFVHTIASTEHLDYWYWIWVSVALGITFRIIAFILLLTVHKRVGCEV